MRHVCAALALGAFVLVGAAQASAQTIQVTPLTREDRVLVTFRLTDAFTEEVRAAIHSGLPITFVYDVQLKRGVSLWLDRTIASATVTATVRYDPLTRRYLLTRREDGRIDRTQTVEREEVVHQWLTEFERLPLFSAGVTRGERRVLPAGQGAYDTPEHLVRVAMGQRYRRARQVHIPQVALSPIAESSSLTADVS